MKILKAPRVSYELWHVVEDPTSGGCELRAYSQLSMVEARALKKESEAEGVQVRIYKVTREIVK